MFQVRELAKMFTLALIRRIPFILGIFIIVSGICGIFDVMSDQIQGSAIRFVDGLSPFIRIFGGVLIFLDPKRNVVRAVGFYALTIGASRLLTSIGPLISSNDFLFIIGCVLMGLSINMFVSGFMYLRGTSRGRNRLFITSTLMLLLQCIETGFAISRQDAMSIINSGVMSLMYVALIVTLDTEEVRKGMLYEQINKFVRGSRLSTTLDPRLVMSRNDALVFKHAFTDRRNWNKINDGIVEEETVVSILDFDGSEYIRLQKWKGSGKIYCVLSDSPDGTLIQGKRFAVEKVTDDGKSDELIEWIRLFDNDRLIAHIAVDSNTYMEGI